MTKKKYKIRNYGNTRTVYVKGQSWELSKNAAIEVEDKEVADAFEMLPFIDVEVIEQPIVKTKSSKRKKKKKATTQINKTIKQSKN